MNWLVLTHLFAKRRTRRSRKSYKKRKTKTSRYYNKTSRRKLMGG